MWETGIRLNCPFNLNIICLIWKLTQEALGLRLGCSVMGNFLAILSVVGTRLCRYWDHTWTKHRGRGMRQDQRDIMKQGVKEHSFKDFRLCEISDFLGLFCLAFLPFLDGDSYRVSLARRKRERGGHAARPRVGIKLEPLQ